MLYVVGSPHYGPFTEPKEFESDEAAKDWTQKNYGPVVDEMDWPGERGENLILLVVEDE